MLQMRKANKASLLMDVFRYSRAAGEGSLQQFQAARHVPVGLSICTDTLTHSCLLVCSVHKTL